MKKIIIAFILFSTIVNAQTPNKMSFQTVVRNSLGKLVANKSIGVRLSILKTTSTGSAVYVETHSKTSNVNGLLTLEVGIGTVTSGTFSTIDWSQGPYFLKTEMDMDGGTNYTITGVTEFVSVPYAKMSDAVKTVANGANIGDMNYWNGNTWVPLNVGSEGQTLTICSGKPTWTIGGVCPGTITALNCSSATNNGTLSATTTSSGVTSVISYTGGNGGVQNGQVVASTGVAGLTATLQPGTFANGNGTLTYNITGTPATSGTASFALNIGGKTCMLTRSVLLLSGVISTLDCATSTSNGTLTASTTASGVTSVISYTGGNGGIHNGQVVVSTGVTGLTATLQSGTFANGNGTLTYNITGTPATSGTASFALNIGGKTCALTRSVLLLGGAISTLDCATATNNGTLIATTTASAVASVISYTSGNGGIHNGQVVASTGVAGLTATLQSGTFANGNGTLTYNITGTPASSGTASFALNIGGKTCTLTRSVLLTGVISTLDCATATKEGKLIAKTTASLVKSVISYTIGNGGVHNGQVVVSTGVTGLTATLQAGTFANGNGSLTYIITGTPSASGTASFALNIGSKTCILTRIIDVAQTAGINFTSIGSPVGSFLNNISDIEGNTYKTVQIGNQVWMGENLKTSKYNDGTTIPNITESTSWGQWVNTTTGAWTYYVNDAYKNAKYGKLYNWYAVSTTSNGNKNLCPTGWHVPTDAEWTVLTDYLGGESEAGGKMKEVGTTSWSSPNTNATNSSLFTGLPSGIRDINGDSEMSYYGSWWSSSSSDNGYAMSIHLFYNEMFVAKLGGDKIDGYSVRCLRDQPVSQ